jgi:hypothetical protein
LSADPPRLYWIHGLLVESEIPLEARRIDSDAGGGEASGSITERVLHYRLTVGEPRDCPPSPPPGRILAEVRDDGFESWTTESRSDPGLRTLRYARICDVTLDRGQRTITVHRSPEADPALIPIFLEGAVLAHALAAEDLLALHASAVEVGGQALAIVGQSGAGKSTLAALLCSEGAHLVADDALRVDATESGPVCFPGSGGLRLRAAASGLGDEIEGAAIELTPDGRTKVIPGRAMGGPLKLGAALVPEPSRDATRLEVRRLAPMDALQQLLRYPRLVSWQAPEPIGRLFQLTARVAAVLPVYRATVPWGPPFPPNLAEELLASVGLTREVA